MKKIEKIDIVFENCEVFTIKGKDINQLIIEDIHESISKIAINTIANQKIANSILLHISNDANEYVKEQGFQIHDEIPKGLMRIAEYNDITQICLYYNDATNETIYPSWVGDCEYSNEAQETYFIENCENKELNGFLIVIVSNLNKRNQMLKEYCNSLTINYKEKENSNSE